MLKIEKTLNKESDWLIVDADFRGLQMALAFADCGLNEKGIDDIAYVIYSDKLKADAHSVTAVNTFIKPLHKKVVEIEDEEGNITIFGEDQKIKVIRDGDYAGESSAEIEILGSDFRETDIFVGYA